MQWIYFNLQKPKNGQMCIVAAGPNSKVQGMAVTWDEHEEEFYWFDALGLDPYPTEATTHWMPFPDDPVA
jgi:hypothetical protein